MFCLFSGIGSVTVMKGSNVMDYLLQTGQVTLDLYCPVIRSVTMDWLRLMCPIQLYKATSASPFPLLSTDWTYGLLRTLLRSSCSPSIRKEKNS